jgi:hypothetical protein
MGREEEWLRKLAEAYFDPTLHPNLQLDDDDPEEADYDRERAIISQVLALPIDEPEDCWRFIEIACGLSLTADQLGLLGAGILEDLMDDHGAEFLDRVEASAKESAAMQAVVDAVWTMSMDPYVARAFKTIQSHKGKRP